MKKLFLALVALSLLLSSCMREKKDTETEHETPVRITIDEPVNISPTETVIEPTENSEPANPPATVENSSSPEDIQENDASQDFTEPGIKVMIGQRVFDLDKSLSDVDLKDLSPEELALLRNSYFAKHGYMFKNEKYTRFFSDYDWYNPQHNSVEEHLTYTDKANINVVMKAEGKAGGYYALPEEYILSDPQKWVDKNDFLNFESTNVSEYHYEYKYPADIDVNSDGIYDSIIYDCDYIKPLQTLSINDQKLDMEIWNNNFIFLEDLDEDDPYIEIVVLIEGFDISDEYRYYRYTGSSIEELGSLDNSLFSYGGILSDGEGKLLPNYNYLFGATPMILTGYYELSESALEFKHIDKKYYENREYEFAKDAVYFFGEGAEHKSQYDWEYMEIKKGEKIYIKEIGISYSNNCIRWAYVILGDGREGFLYPCYEFAP